MAGVTLRNFRILDRKGSTRLEAKEATVAQAPWRILLWDVDMPDEALEKTLMVNLFLEGPKEGHLISGEKSWKLMNSSELQTSHEEK
jgi:hypothetical protein